jgi:hypothetical protein
MTRTSTEQPSLAAIIHDLRESHARTSPGAWGKGATTHETVSRTEGREPYKVAEFRHANDAQFCDLAHVFVPRLLSEIEALQSRIQEPHGWKLVPVELLERIQESLGSFVSDQGWSQSDMDTADALDGLLARDLVEDTDPDDVTFDDFDEDVEDNECHNCSGTGEGMYDSQSCVVCLGKGFL